MLTKLSRTLLAAQSAQHAKGVLKSGELSQVTELAFYVVFGKTTTGGKVVIETAHDPAYAGRWALVAPIVWEEPDRVHHVAVTAEHLALQARIAEPILGGDVTVLVVGS